jgi:hypothetical protein
MDEEFDKRYNFEDEGNPYCKNYKTPKEFLNVVEDAIHNFLYHKHFEDILDVDDVEFDNVIYLVSNYIKNNYGDVIKNKFIEGCNK